MKSFIPASYFLISVAAVSAVAAKPNGPFVLVVTSPSANAAETMSVLEKAGGAFVGESALSWVSVAYSDEPDFPKRLLQAGAFLVLNHNLAVGCLQGRTT